MARSYDIAILSQKVEQLEGSIKANDVIANPTGDTTADLTKVQIDGTKYKVSNVKANPTGEITNDITGMELDGTKYNIKSMTNYTSAEQIVGYWVDGSPVYSKILDLGTMPNTASTKYVAHDITNFLRFIKIEGMLRTQTGYINIPLPFVASATTDMISIFADETNVSIVVNKDRSNLIGFAILYYLKTSATTSTRSRKKKEE